jgi:hypothetical protein
MKEYEFTLKFNFSDISINPESFVDLLGRDGCDDATLRPVQLSTTLLICFPCEPAFLGVLQILKIQNSPQRHSILLYGQYILPQASMRYTWIHAINEPRNFSNKTSRAEKINVIPCVVN